MRFPWQGKFPGTQPEACKHPVPTRNGAARSKSHHHFTRLVQLQRTLRLTFNSRSPTKGTNIFGLKCESYIYSLQAET